MTKNEKFWYLIGPNEYSTRIACFCGAILATIFIEIPVEYCIISQQCIANYYYGSNRLYYIFKRLTKKYKLI